MSARGYALHSVCPQLAFFPHKKSWDHLFIFTYTRPVVVQQAGQTTHLSPADRTKRDHDIRQILSIVTVGGYEARQIPENRLSQVKQI